MDIEIKNNFYNKLRDISYVIFVIGSLLPIFIEMNTKI